MADDKLVSNIVTAEDAARHDGTPGSRAREIAGAYAGPAGVLFIRAENGRWLDVPAGHWVIRYGPGDLGVMSHGAFTRWFGAEDCRERQAIARELLGEAGNGRD